MTNINDVQTCGAPFSNTRTYALALREHRATVDVNTRVERHVYEFVLPIDVPHDQCIVLVHCYEPTPVHRAAESRRSRGIARSKQRRDRPLEFHVPEMDALLRARHKSAAGRQDPVRAGRKLGL